MYGKWLQYAVYLKSFVSMIFDRNSLFSRLRKTPMGRLFWDKKFFHYTWIGLLISALNVFFLWLLIDIFHIPTVIAGFLVVGGTFLFRYVLFAVFKVL